MVKKIVFCITVLMGIGFLLFCLFVSRPYYLARYALPVFVLTAISGTWVIAWSLRGKSTILPRTFRQWIGLYYGSLLIVGSVFSLVRVYPYIGESNRYNNPYITSQNAYSMAFDEAAIDADVRWLMGKPAPDCIFYSMHEGRQRSLDDYHGNVVILNFWATWCPPCVAELPALDTLSANYRENGLVVITLSSESQDTLSNFLKHRTLRTCVGRYDQNVVPLVPYHALPMIPQTFIVDRAGALREWVVGHRTYKEFEAMIKPYL